MRYGPVLEEIEPKSRIWNPEKLDWEYVGAPTDPFAGYVIHDRDEGGAIEYFGYVDIYENWIIKRVTASSVRYAKGSGDYADNYSDRAILTYDYLFNL